MGVPNSVRIWVSLVVLNLVGVGVGVSLGLVHPQIQLLSLPIYERHLIYSTC